MPCRTVPVHSIGLKRYFFDVSIFDVLSALFGGHSNVVCLTNCCLGEKLIPFQLLNFRLSLIAYVDINFQLLSAWDVCLSQFPGVLGNLR
jgi:hypothetical protein